MFILFLFPIFISSCCSLSLNSSHDVISNGQYERYSFGRRELDEYKSQVKELFYFAHDNYLEFAYPYDELQPISCVPKTRNFKDPDDLITNDVLGNFSVTLIDSLTTIAIFNDKEKFISMIELIEETFPGKFDIDSTIQVFETTIRIIGGLLSSHLYATDPTKKVYLGASYTGSLLDLAKDMADRLLPAYLTSTGLPVPRINLRNKFSDISTELVSENNVAAMACPMFEFTMLSYLTNDEKYSAVTRYAMNKTWSMRSEIDLLPMSFNPETGQSYSQITGIGASIDSFYEYALKGAILFDDKHLFKIWQDSYKSLCANCKADWFYVNAQASTGQLLTPWIDSLSAFFPGLQVLAGDVEDAIFKNLMSLKLWDTFGGIPERWQFQGVASLPSEMKLTLEQKKKEEQQHRTIVPLEWYPLRPEFIESTYFLYRATKDPFYLNIGLEILESLKNRFRYKCGFGGIQDVITGAPQDRMESFVLSETMKYLYLLFDEDNELHKTRDNVVFSTEAHPMWLKTDVLRSYRANKFFNDTLYIRHLDACKQHDDDTDINGRKISFMGEKLVELAKSFFIDEKRQGFAKSDMPDRQHYEPEIKDSEKQEVCVIVNEHQNSSGWSYSKMLSEFGRLFEIDYRYHETLVKPSYISKHLPTDLKPGFYQRWANPKRSVCRLPPNTESFEIIIDLPGESDLIKMKNGSICCNALSGRWKLRVEKMQPGNVDSYGEVVKADLFNGINCKDIFRPTSDMLNQGYSPTYLYRITVINGIRLPREGTITLHNQNLSHHPQHTKTLHELFGCNIQNQLMFEHVPIVNFLLI